MATNVSDPRNTKTAVIANGGTTSGAIALGGDTPIGLFMPSAFTGTAITFQGSNDGSTFQAVNNATGSAVSVTVAASKAIGFDSATTSALMPWRLIKLVSGSAEGGARSVVVISRQV